MMMNSYFMLEHIKVHQDELTSLAERHRILKAARQERRAERASQRALHRARQETVKSAAPSPAPIAGNLASCGRHVAGSAR